MLRNNFFIFSFKSELNVNLNCLKSCGLYTLVWSFPVYLSCLSLFFSQLTFTTLVGPKSYLLVEFSFLRLQKCLHELKYQHLSIITIMPLSGICNKASFGNLHFQTRFQTHVQTIQDQLSPFWYYIFGDIGHFFLKSVFCMKTSAIVRKNDEFN